MLQNQLKQENTRKLEVESQYQQLVATNQILDTRMMELKRKKEDSVGKLKEVDAQRDALQTQCDILTKDKGWFWLVKVEMIFFENVIIILQTFGSKILYHLIASFLLAFNHSFINIVAMLLSYHPCYPPHIPCSCNLTQN